jgi:pyruvate/2-oxoglutarate/acetoin dehydrogenase E1 component
MPEVREISYSEAIREALTMEMRRDDRVFLMGEDIGVYGGAFGVTLGMIDEFGAERIRETPISEGVIAGAAIGAALVGMRPVAEIMFMDFVTIAMEQIVNQGAKIRYMFGGHATVPMVLRTPAGSGTGAAAHHSQSLEAWLAHVPGLKVVMPSTPYDAKGLLLSSIRDPNPVMFVEHKLLYPRKGPVPEHDYEVPLGLGDVKREGTDLTIIATSIMVPRSLEAAEQLSAEGIEAEVVDPRTLRPLDMETIEASVKKTGRVMIVHEAPVTGGFGGEVAARIAGGAAFEYLEAPIRRFCGLDTPIPYNRTLEYYTVPQPETIAAAARELAAA